LYLRPLTRIDVLLLTGMLRMVIFVLLLKKRGGLALWSVVSDEARPPE
jgi:hypothetical protein